MTLPPLPAGAYRALPEPAVARQAELGLSRWHEAAAAADPALAEKMRDLAGNEAGQRLLAAIFGNSPFLSQICVNEPETLLSLVTAGPGGTFADITHRLNQELDSPADRQTLMNRLRIARRQVALTVAVADLAQWWPLER